MRIYGIVGAIEWKYSHKKRKAVSITGEIQDLVNYKKKNNNKNKKGSMSKKRYHKTFKIKPYIIKSMVTLLWPKKQ